MTGGTPKPTRLVNLTPHPVRVALEGGGYVDLPAAGVARVVEDVVDGGLLTVPEGNIRVTGRVGGGEVEGLPAERTGTALVVSRRVAEAVPERQDLLVPGRLEKDAGGRVVACGSLSRRCRSGAVWPARRSRSAAGGVSAWRLEEDGAYQRGRLGLAGGVLRFVVDDTEVWSVPASAVAAVWTRAVGGGSSRRLPGRALVVGAAGQDTEFLVFDTRRRANDLAAAAGAARRADR